jgi:aspartate/methionine/tyrosine aminotransferase
MLTWQQRLKQQLTYSMPRPTKDPADFAAQGHWVYAPVVVLAIEETRDTLLEMLEKHGRWVWVWPQAYCCAWDPKWSEVVDCTQVVGEWP